MTDYTPPVKKYKIVQGDTFKDGFFVTETNPVTEIVTPKNLTGVEITATIKTRLSKDAPVIAQCTIADGITVTDGDGTNDFFEFRFVPLKMNSVPVRTVYMDLQFKFSEEESYTFLQAEIEVIGQGTPHQ